jgi:soluble P-type ATPase
MDEKAEKTGRGIHLDIPGHGPLTLTRLLLDYTGTLSCDGVLIPGVAQRLSSLGRQLEITVLTADTFGTAAAQLSGLPLALHRIETGRDKVAFLSGIDPSQTAAVGNGFNDVGMLRGVALGIAVVGPEGCSSELITAGRVVCPDILAALDLLLKPLRAKATLRT